MSSTTPKAVAGRARRLCLWLLDLVFERHDIGREGDVYLTRWVLWGRRYGDSVFGKVFLHHFHRSDWDEALHDHPWGFWSLILADGYFEHTPSGRRYFGPLCLLRRPAVWKHRVELLPGRSCWTLVWTGNKERSWGFTCPDGRWVPWKDFVDRIEANSLGCGGDDDGRDGRRPGT